MMEKQHNPKPMLQGLSLILLLAALSSCSKSSGAPAAPLYDSIPAKSMVLPIINEGSGLADSRKNPGYLWVAEDSGNPPRLFLLSHNGTVEKSIYLDGAVNHDWEEIQLSGDSLLVADIGDNHQIYDTHTIYLLAEPAAANDTAVVSDSIRFRYPDHPHDAEAFLVDPETRDLFIITKSDNPARIYRLPYPYPRNTVITASPAGQLAFAGVVASCISPDGKKIIVKTYASLRQFERKSGQSLADCLQGSFTSIPYRIEPQGEAVCFAADQSGYFTLSEKGLASSVFLYFYRAF